MYIFQELLKPINAELQDTILQSLLEEGEQFSGLSLIGAHQSLELIDLLISFILL